MINATTGTNEVTVTLKDRIDINPVFLILWLQWTSQTDEIKALQVIDQASDSCKANEIVFEVVTSGEDLPNGKVILKGGNYNYKIYQSATSGTDITGKKLLESGLLRYDLESETSAELDAPTTEKTLD